MSATAYANDQFLWVLRMAEISGQSKLSRLPRAAKAWVSAFLYVKGEAR